MFKRLTSSSSQSAQKTSSYQAIKTMEKFAEELADFAKKIPKSSSESVRLLGRNLVNNQRDRLGYLLSEKKVLLKKTHKKY
jgi:hypothetical protein